jgi:ribosomal protein S18 acetylase RimI-like enzyme
MPAPTGPQFITDPDFGAEHSYLKQKPTGERVAMSYVDTPEGRLHYDVRTSPGSFNVEVKHGSKTIGSMYGPGASPGDTETEIPIGEVSVHSQYARRGLATQMLRLARQNMPEGVNVVHSPVLTESGKKWVKGLRDKGVD